MFLISIHRLPKCRPKTCCSATVFQIKSLHRRYKLHITHPAASGRLRSLRCTSFPNKVHLTLLGPFCFPAVIPNPCCSVLFLRLISASVGAIDPPSICREGFSAVLAPFGSKPLQGCIQFRIIGQYALPEIPAHGISAVNLLQHHAVTIQRQAAEIFVIIGTAVCHKFSDSSSFFFGQFPNGFCHGQMVPFCFIVVSNPSCPLGLPPH